MRTSSALRLGSLAWMIGAALLIVFRVAHPPTESASAIRSSPHYELVHVVGAGAMLLIMVGSIGYWAAYIRAAGRGAVIGVALIVLGGAMYIADYAGSAFYTTIIVQGAPDLYELGGSRSGPWAAGIRPYQPMLRDVLFCGGLAALGIATIEASRSSRGSYLLVAGALAYMLLTRHGKVLALGGTVVLAAALVYCAVSLWRSVDSDDADQRAGAEAADDGDSWLITQP